MHAKYKWKQHHWSDGLFLVSFWLKISINRFVWFSSSPDQWRDHRTMSCPAMYHYVRCFWRFCPWFVLSFLFEFGRSFRFQSYCSLCICGFWGFGCWQTMRLEIFLYFFLSTSNSSLPFRIPRYTFLPILHSKYQHIPLPLTLPVLLFCSLQLPSQQQ